MRNQQIHIRVNERELRAIQQVAKALEKSVSQIVREAFEKLAR